MPLSVLLVDDEPLLIEELQEALEFEGYDVATASSVAEALSQTDKARFDLVVTDLKMPGQGGLDLIRALCGRTDAPRIIVLSGHGAQSNRTEALAQGAAACMAKPVDIDTLLVAIQDSCA